MRLSMRQIFATVVSVVVTLGLLYAGQQVYERTAVSVPLIRAVSAMPGVARAQLATDTPTPTIRLWLKPGAALGVVYPAVISEARAVTGGPVAVSVIDNPTPAEKATFNAIRFVIAQGEATGQYVAMAEGVTALARAHHEQASLVMGNSALYLTLTDGAGHRLMAVMPLTMGGQSHV